MATQCYLTLQEVAQLALGGPSLADDNIKILHGLLEYLLRKLDCQQETVTIGGVDAMATIRDTLAHSQKSTVLLESEHFKPLTEVCAKFDEVDALTRSAEDTFERHLAYVTKSDRKNTMYRSVFWERYSMPTEDACFSRCCEKDPAQFKCALDCKLMRQPDFVNKLMRRSAKPIDQRMIQITQQFSEIRQRFQQLLAFVNDQRTLIAGVEVCVIKTENLRKQIADNYRQFSVGVTEIQDFINAKLTKAYLPEITIYVRERCAEMQRAMEKLQEQRPAPPEMLPIDDQGLRCMSCCSVLGDLQICCTGDDKTKEESEEKTPDDPCPCEKTTRMPGNSIGSFGHSVSQLRRRSKPKKPRWSFGSVSN